MRGWWAAVALAAVAAAGVGQWLRPLPAPQAVVTAPSQGTGRAPALPWPATGEAAVAVPAAGWQATHGGDRPLPIASVTKLMTAWLLVKRYPLSVGQAGPSLLVTPADVRLYQLDAAGQQSVAPVTAGQRLSERQVLEGLLVASANNLATMVARWVAGSQGRFVQMMNRTAQALGMRHTHYAGPSGLNPATVSTAADQLRLAERVMQNPVLAQIVALPQISWPGAPSPLYNYNYLVGHDGIVGIKTGSTTQAGGCFVFAAPANVGGQRAMIYGAVLGQFAAAGGSQLQAALDAGRRLLDAVRPHLMAVTAARAGAPVGRLVTAWGAQVPVLAERTLQMVAWPGTTIRRRLVWPTGGAARAGALEVFVGSRRYTVPVRVAAPLPSPPAWWRLTRL